MKFLATTLILAALAASAALPQRIKDVAYFRGETTTQLIGYGLVVGLAGSGDTHRSTFTQQSIVSMLKRFGVTVPDTYNRTRTRNVAAVMVTATIDNQLKPGGVFDVNVSSMGDAKSLMGGQLLQTPMLSHVTGELYGFAQGAISVGGYDINTATGGRIIKNHALNGRVPGGGSIMAALPGGVANTGEVGVYLKEPDYTTANNVALAINAQFGQAIAQAADAAEVRVQVPAGRQANLAGFLAELESTPVTVDVAARVVLNERTGTVVAGENVRINPVTITHGSLKIQVKAFPIISQPSPFSRGETVLFNNLVPYTETVDSAHVVTIEQPTTNVAEVAAALNSLRVSPRDVIAIFQAIKEAGALPAELVVM
ncbi:MAG: flagellar basal body P-ring protein FlgI [Ignavibacteriales bacterium]|nr:flagellar basal body P-ring protein FlgI [Ignavibacteriales bacterium]